MQQTDIFKLNKPEYTDTADIKDLNENTDIIDENLGKITQPTYTDTAGNKYTDINGMHLRTDNSIYAQGGIRILNCDPCTDGKNITEADIDSRDNTLAEIDSYGDGSFQNVEVENEVSAGFVKADSVRGDSIYTVAGTRVTGRSVHFEKVKGAVYADNSEKDTEDGSRKLIVGAYHDTPEVDDNYIPATEPDAGIIARVESDAADNGTYLDLYADQVVCRNDGAEFKVGTVRADTVRGDVIRAGTTLKIGGDSVADLLDEKADTSHTHSLDGDDITGTLPIEKGGTGGTTAAIARSKLGLGDAATKTYTDSIAEGNNDLPTSGAVYTAINNIEVSGRTHIVIATYDTENTMKAAADYTCTSTNASEIIQNAIDEISEGGKIELLDGTYNMQWGSEETEIKWSVDINKKGITIEGCGGHTVIQQVNESNSETKAIFRISANSVTLKNMMLSDSNVSSPIPTVLLSSDSATFDNIFFIFNASETSAFGGCVRGTENDCGFTRIQNCRVYKGFNNDSIPMFDFSECSNFGGVIGANISSGYNYISVKFASDAHKNNTAIYGHVGIDIL